MIAGVRVMRLLLLIYQVPTFCLLGNRSNGRERGFKAIGGCLQVARKAVRFSVVAHLPHALERDCPEMVELSLEV